MELDDLRRQWQQPDPATPPPVSPAQLQGLLDRTPTDVVAKIRRNMWLETILTGLITLALPFYIVAYPSAFHRMYGASGMLLAVVLLYYYYRQLRLLGRMARAEGQVRAHLTELIVGLRRQLRFYYRLTLATSPYLLIMVLGFFVGQELARPTAFRWALMGGVAAGLLVFGAVMQVGIVYATRWYLQRLYGQHLDRLEASLRELGDEPAG